MLVSAVLVGNGSRGIAQQVGQLGRDALVAVGEVQDPRVCHRPAEGAQVRFVAHRFGVLVHEPDSRGEYGAKLDQLIRFGSSARPTGSGASDAISALEVTLSARARA